MLAILLGIFYWTGLKAQNYTYPGISHSEYGKLSTTSISSINQYKVVDDAHFSTNDPRIKLTMNCLAANGYGQWTVSSDMGDKVDITGHPWLFSPNQHDVNTSGTWNPNGTVSPNSASGWFLLGNLIGEPSESFDGTSSHPGCQPPGVVSGGPFNDVSGTTFPVAESQVAANLNGRVRYVAVEPTSRTSFLIEGLNDERGATSAERQIDITLGGLPNPAVKRQIVQAQIYTYTSASTSSGGSTHAVIPASGEPDNQDQFWTAMDKKYLYIVWCSPNGGNLEVWATALYLSDGSVASGYPLKVAGFGGTNFKRPTVDCDKRNNPLLPEFGVAWITGGMVQVAVYGGTAYTGPGIVKPAPVIPAIFGVPETLPAFFHDPFLSGSTNDHSYLGAATHARIVVSSSPSTTPDYSVYVLEDLLTTPSGFVHDFIFYKGLNLIPASEIRATYVDGLFNTGTPASYPAPPTPTTFTLLGIKDKFITAFSNPYDNQDLTNGYNQYHCLYQPLFQNNTTSEFKQPLVILRGFDNGFANAGTTDTRLILNQAGGVLDDPTSYCGAVNQMGIHIHWRTSANDHFYVRDTRAFDEPIEEHTLLTNDCIVADGTAHGGTAGTQILDEGVGRVTLWTDPNYAANVSGGGLYFQYPGGFATTGFFDKKNIGTLTFNSSGLALTAGTTDGSSIASLYTMPLCSIAQTGSAGAITINPYSNWEYYGTNIPGSKDWGLASLTVNLNGPNTGSVIPNLNIHGGAIFWECAALNVSHGMINILFGSNINPINTTENTTDKVSGLLRVSSITDMHDSKINSYIPIVSWNDDELHLSSDKFKNVVMMITAVNGLERPSIYSLHSVNNIYTNFETLSSTNRTGAGAIILYDGNPNCSEGVSSPDKVVFNGDIFNRIRFHGMAPGKAGLELQSLIINDWDLNPIFIERSCSLDYKDILVYNVTFNNILDDMAPFDVAQGILIRDFNKGDRFGDLNVNNNQFIYYDTHSLPTTGFVVLIEAAIELDNSTGNVENNTIKSDIFAVGIWVHNDVNNNIIKPYLCNNFIKGLRGRLIGTFFSAVPGIKSDHYQGYVNLCTIDGCEYGYESDQLDNPFLIHSTIVNSRSSGLFIPGSLTTTNLAKVHLTGLHSDLPCTTCLDFAGNNNISNNGIHSSDAQILIEEPDQLCDLGKMVGSSWGSWGHNKIAQGTATTAWLIKTQYFDNSNPATFANIGSIDQNYWGGINPFSLLPIPNASASFAAIYTATNGSEDPLWVDSSSFFGCSDYSPSEKINQKNNPALLFQTPGWADTCAHLKLWSAGMPQDQEHYQLQYDTLRLFIEKCAVSDRYSYQVFTTIDGANQFRSDDTNRYTQYRSWLISVLYLNTIQPAYFCACMGSIGNTYQKANEFLSVWNYLRHNHPECWSTALDKQYSQDSASSAHRGENPTHLIPLDSLGLGFLLKGAVSPSDGSTLPSQYLASFTSSPNPFNKETTLQFTLNRMTYTTVAVYDELGRLVWGDGRGSSLEAGTHTIHLDASNFPSGTLYARISTGFGEVKTVKLIHE